MDQLADDAAAAGAHPDVPDARRSRGDRRLELQRRVGAHAAQPPGRLPHVAQDADRLARGVLDVPGLVQQGAVAMEPERRARRGAREGARERHGRAPAASALHPCRLFHAGAVVHQRKRELPVGNAARLALPAAVRSTVPRAGLPDAQAARAGRRQAAGHRSRRPVQDAGVADHRRGAARMDARDPAGSAARRFRRVHRGVDAVPAAEEVHGLHAEAGGRRWRMGARRRHRGRRRGALRLDDGWASPPMPCCACSAGARTSST